MLKRDSEMRWNLESRQSFDQVKQALTKALVLISPDFIIFSFASEHIVAAVLLQKKMMDLNSPLLSSTRL